MRQDNKKTTKKSKTPIAIIIVLLVIIATLIGVWVHFSGSNSDPTSEAADKRPINPLTGLRAETLPNRVVQFSIDNVEAIPQSGLSKADIIFEMPAEGGLTRLQALFYGESPDVVGPIRSARPYFIDVSREYNSIFVHHGASLAGNEYLNTGVVEDISPLYNDGVFYRSNTRVMPHNSMLHYADLWEAIRDRGLDVAQEIRTFTFAPEATKDKKGEESVAPTVTKITVDNPYTLVEYKYIQETNLYEHYVDGDLYIDAENDAPITESNILIQYIKSAITADGKTLSINMTAGGKALLFTGGNMVEGTWARANLDAPTIFTDTKGNEFVLTRGKTWVHVVDQNSKVTYK